MKKQSGTKKQNRRIKRILCRLLAVTLLFSCLGGVGSVRAAEEVLLDETFTITDTEPLTITAPDDTTSFVPGTIPGLDNWEFDFDRDPGHIGGVTGVGAAGTAEVKNGALVLKGTTKSTDTAHADFRHKAVCKLPSKLDPARDFRISFTWKNTGSERNSGNQRIAFLNEEGKLIDAFWARGTNKWDMISNSDGGTGILCSDNATAKEFVVTGEIATNKLTFTVGGKEITTATLTLDKFLETAQIAFVNRFTTDEVTVDNLRVTQPEKPDETLELSGLTVDGTALEVDPAQTDYQIIVPEGTESVQLAATAKGEVSMDPADGKVTLINGAGTGTVTVTGADGAKTKTYTVSLVAGKNVALGKPVTATPPGLEGFEAEKITDGVISPSSRYDGGENAKDVLSEIDLGGLCEVGSISYTELGGALPYRTDHLTVSYTADGTNWTDIVKGGTLKGAQTTIGGQLCFQRTFLFPKIVKASKLRARCENTGASTSDTDADGDGIYDTTGTANAGTSILEIMAFGTKATRVFHDTFEDNAKGAWTNVGTGVTFENEKMVLSADSTTAGNVKADRGFDETTQDKATVFVDLAKTSDGNPNLFLRFFASTDPGANPAVQMAVQVESGKLYLRQSAGTSTIELYSVSGMTLPETKLKFVLNFSTQTFDFYAGDMNTPKKENVVFRNVPTVTKRTDVKQITVRSGAAVNATIDNVAVYDGFVEGDEPAEPEPGLTSLTVNGSAVAVDPAKTDYQIIVPAGTASVRLTAAANGGKITMTPEDETVTLTEGVGSAEISLAMNDGTEKTYRINITAGQNVLLNKTLTVDPQKDPIDETMPPSMINDGVISGTNRYNAGDGAAEYIETVFDLDGVYELGSLSFAEYGGGQPYRTNNLEVWASPDGTVWTEAMSDGSMKDAAAFGTDGGAYYQKDFIFPKTIVAAKLKVRAANTGYGTPASGGVHISTGTAAADISIVELMAYGAAVAGVSLVKAGEGRLSILSPTAQSAVVVIAAYEGDSVSLCQTYPVTLAAGVIQEINYSDLNISGAERVRAYALSDMDAAVPLTPACVIKQ